MERDTEWCRTNTSASKSVMESIQSSLTSGPVHATPRNPLRAGPHRGGSCIHPPAAVGLPLRRNDGSAVASAFTMGPCRVVAQRADVAALQSPNDTRFDAPGLDGNRAGSVKRPKRCSTRLDKRALGWMSQTAGENEPHRPGERNRSPGSIHLSCELGRIRWSSVVATTAAPTGSMPRDATPQKIRSAPAMPFRREIAPKAPLTPRGPRETVGRFVVPVP